MGKKQDLIMQFEQARAKFLASIEGLEEDQFYEAGACGIWSVKDLLAHITAWESELITALVHVENKNKGVPHIITIEDIDEWNAERYHENVTRDLDVIWEDFLGVGKHLIQAINALDEKTLTDHRLFPWLEGEALSYLIYEDAIWHEEEHAEDIWYWREDAENSDCQSDDSSGSDDHAAN